MIGTDRPRCACLSSSFRKGLNSRLTGWPSIRTTSAFRRCSGPARQPPQSRAPMAASSVRCAGTSVNDAAPTANSVSGYAPIGPHQRRYPPPPQIDRSGYFRESPIAAYQRINGMFDRMGVESSPRMASGARLAANVSNPETSPRSVPDVPSQSRLASGDTARSASTVDPTAPVDLQDGRGNPVVSDRTRQPILRPAARP